MDPFAVEHVDPLVQARRWRLLSAEAARRGGPHTTTEPLRKLLLRIDVHSCLNRPPDSSKTLGAMATPRSVATVFKTAIHGFAFLSECLQFRRTPVVQTQPARRSSKFESSICSLKPKFSPPPNTPHVEGKSGSANVTLLSLEPDGYVTNSFFGDDDCAQLLCPVISKKDVVPVTVLVKPPTLPIF